MALKLRVKADSLKALYLVENARRTALEQRGYSGGNSNNYTFYYESESGIPANARLVAEIYDQAQTFDAPFKVENITLLGIPLNVK